jgi:hypothetical protein
MNTSWETDIQQLFIKGIFSPSRTSALVTSNEGTFGKFSYGLEFIEVSFRGPLVRHAQDNLAPCVPFRSLFIGLARLGKGEHRLDDWSQLSRVNE